MALTNFYHTGLVVILRSLTTKSSVLTQNRGVNAQLNP